MKDPKITNIIWITATNPSKVHLPTDSFSKGKNNCVKAFLYFKNILDIDVPFEGHRLLIKYKYVM